MRLPTSSFIAAMGVFGVMVLAALASGCEAANPFYRPEGLSGDGGGLGGASDAFVASGDLAQPAPDLAHPHTLPDLTMPSPDLTMPVDGVGDPCKIACDCNPGLACVQGHCDKVMQGPVYCCQSMDCPMGAHCQAMDGSFGQCGMGNGPGWCMFIPCMTDNGCKTSGCGFCNMMTHHCQ